MVMSPVPESSLSTGASASSSHPSQTPRPTMQTRSSTRRPRVEDDEESGDEAHRREYNRQRMNSPTDHDHEHHFMPIPEDHGVPRSTRDSRAASPQRNAGPASAQGEQSRQGQGPAPPPYRTWTFDFLPIPGHNGQMNVNGQPPADGQPAQQQHANHDAHPFMNFFVNFPIPGHGPAPPTGAAPNNAHGNARPIFILPHYSYPWFTVGGNGPGHAGFAFPPFPFPFGMDALEERDDPERAKRLVDGLEEVPPGLIKRMQRVGGPGSSQGEVPNCAVCLESLLEPEGGGYEGNAELAKAEADQAERDKAASQQGRESPMEVDSSAAAAPSSSSSSGEPSSTAGASSSTSAPEATGETKYPKIVVLPCSHAFHATCLLPWFSKPGRTTCPSCRFDIDPDSLTYKPRPIRMRTQPQPAQQGGAAAQPQQPPQTHTHFHPIFFGPPPPPAPQPAPAPATAASDGSNRPDGAPATNADAEPQPAPAQQQPGQQRQQPLPPFITFDISMIIPIFPGRGTGAAPQPANAAAPTGAQDANSGAPHAHGPVPPPPPPPRTDNNGLRLDDTLLQDAVRTTFERTFGIPAPPVFFQPPPAAAPTDNAAQEGTGVEEGNGAQGDNGAHWFSFALPAFPMPPLNMPGVPHGAPRPRSGPARPAQKRQWVPPPAPGPTLRQVVERNERAMGLRCSDVSCGLGPSDDDPASPANESVSRQISIRPLKSDTSGKQSVCEHKFHPACLVSAGRVAGWGHDVKTGEPADEDEEIEVSCPVCRAVGAISRVEWEQGACELV